jgi:amidase
VTPNDRDKAEKGEMKVTDRRPSTRIVELTISEAQALMEAAELTCRDLVLACLDRISRYDQAGPRINSFLEVNPDALHIAAAMDHEQSRRGRRGPLHGIPVVIKDNIDTADKMHTSAGSVALAGCYAAADSAVAAALRRAGAVIVGKANMTEWANFMTANMPPGYSSRGGQTLNPYGPGKFSVGGSSSGSGAAVAANLAMVGVGTETSGSILSPASSNSVVGIKPTVGSISRRGIIPIMHTQDTAGPLARTVFDAAIALGVMVGRDDGDPATWLGDGRVHSDYARFCDREALAGARLGVPRAVYEKLDEQQLAVMEAAISAMRAAGATLVDPVEMPCARDPYDRTAMLHEFKANINRYLGSLAPTAPVHSLRELIEFNSRHPQAMLRYGQSLLVEAESKSGGLIEPEYQAALADGLHRSTARGIDYALEHHRVDALVVPANYAAAISARPGYPSVTVPGGYTADGRPFGVTFAAGAWSEPALIALAYAFEQATQHRRPPRLDPEAEPGGELSSAC